MGERRQEALHQLQEWLTEACRERNLSWREASIGAGVNPGAVSAIMSGVRPGLQVVINLAEFFDVPPEFLLRLAGHLPPKRAKPGDLSSVARHKFTQLMELGAELPTDLQEEFAEILLGLARIFLSTRTLNNGTAEDEVG